VEKISFRKLRVLSKVTHGASDRDGNSFHIFWLSSYFHQTMNTKKQLANVNEQFPLVPYKVEPKMSFFVGPRSEFLAQNRIAINFHPKFKNIFRSKSQQ
jgi:hypothetical protein